MDKNIFISLAKTFNENGFRLYIIGGTSRDYLLGIESSDYDFVTDATPGEIKDFIPNAIMTFAKYGSVKVKVNNVRVDITTFRLEGDYIDHRHPSWIKFTNNINKDYIRRDFTINAIYIDENFKIIDPSGGLIDLKNKVIRFIGDPDARISEDPLRISRADRFASRLGFTLETRTREAIERNRKLMKELNPDKLKEEQAKAKNK